MDDIYTSRRLRLREIINSLNIKDKRFAERIGKSPGVLSQLLNGYRKISAEVAYEIANQYEWLNPEWLISGKGEMKRGSEITVVYPGVNKDPQMEDVERLREDVLQKYKPDPPLTLGQDLTLRQACYRVLVDNPGQPWPSLVVGGTIYLRIILTNPQLTIPSDRGPVGIP